MLRIYIEGDDSDSPTMVVNNPPPQMSGNGAQYDWVTAFGGVSSLTKTYSGSLTFGACVVNVSWSSMGLGGEGGTEMASSAGGIRADGGAGKVGQERNHMWWMFAQVCAWVQSASPPQLTLNNPLVGQAWRSYYYAGGQRVAMRKGSDTFLLLSDHLGSASVSYNVSTHVAVRERYKAWGELRDGVNSLPTNYTFTGQYSYVESFGLLFYNARWYDPSLSRFTSADTITPNSIQGLDRYHYVSNNPVNRVDPSGHFDTCSATTSKACAVDNGWTFDLIKQWINAGYGYTLADGEDYVANITDAKGRPATTTVNGREWDKANALVVFQGLENANARGWKTSGGTFTLYDSFDDNLSDDETPTYGGQTDGGTSVSFYITSYIPTQNFYHEYGHALNNEYGDRFSTALGSSAHYDSDGDYLYGGNNIGNINPRVLNKRTVSDSNFSSIRAFQHPSTDSNEQWADIFANYMSNNIKNTDLFNWVDSLSR